MIIHYSIKDLFITINKKKYIYKTKILPGKFYKRFLLNINI